MASALALKRKGDRLVDLHEASQITGRTVKGLRNLCYRRQLTFVQRGDAGKIFFWEGDLLAWICRMEKPAFKERGDV